MLSQDAFVAARRADWDELQLMLDQGGPMARLRPTAIARAAAIYRDVCADLMRAQSAGYAPEVIAHLDDLAGRAHNAFYRAPPYRLGAVWDLVARDFPRAIRRQRRFLALAAMLFVLPGVLGFVGALRSRAFGLRLVPASMAEQMEKAYAEGFDGGRDEDTDAEMAGFYVFNNVGIAFRCFATGVLFGLGSAFFLVYNGLVTGAVAGLVTSAGHGRNLFTFMCTHSAFELTAIIVAGTAGLVMGYAMIDTGGLTRFGSLRSRAREVAHLVLGAALMLLVAAAIEGFWSASRVPAPAKWAAAAGAGVMVALYLGLAGRQRPGEPSA